MTLYLGLFAAVLLMVLSGFALFASLVESRRVRLAREHRLGLLQEGLPLEDPAARPWAAGASRFDAQVRHWLAFRIRHQWGMISGAPKLLTVGLASGVATWLVVHLWLGLGPSLVVPLALAAFVGAPRLLLRREQAQAEAQFMTLFPDAVDMIVRMLRAGLPITAGIRAVGNEAAKPVSTVFMELTNQMAIGLEFDEALAVTSRQIGVADFDFFAAALTLQRATGGNLAATLEMLAQIIRRRRGARLKAHAATAEVRLSAIVLGAMPFIVTGLLLLLNPGYLSPLIADPRGKALIAVAIVLLLSGFVTMRRLMRSIETM